MTNCGAVHHIGDFAEEVNFEVLFCFCFFLFLFLFCFLFDVFLFLSLFYFWPHAVDQITLSYSRNQGYTSSKKTSIY